MASLRKIFTRSAAGLLLAGSFYATGSLMSAWGSAARQATRLEDDLEFGTYPKDAGKVKELQAAKDHVDFMEAASDLMIAVSIFGTVAAGVVMLGSPNAGEKEKSAARTVITVKVTVPITPPAPKKIPKKRKPRARPAPKSKPIDLNPGVALQTEIETAPKVKFKRTRAGRTPS